MFERLKRLYEEERISDSHLANAVSKGWITQEEKDQIREVLNLLEEEVEDE